LAERDLLKEDILYNRPDNEGLTIEGYEVLSYIFQATEARVSTIWRDLALPAKIVNRSLEKLVKCRLVLSIRDKRGKIVHLTKKGSLLTLLLDTYAMYAPAAERGDPVVVELMSYLHMLKVPLKEQQLEFAQQLERMGRDLLDKSEAIKKLVQEEGAYD